MPRRVQNVEFGAARPVCSTFCTVWVQKVERVAGSGPNLDVLHPHNVEIVASGRKRSTFCGV
jgi:hypothetical protein